MMQRKSGAGQSTEPTDGGIQLVANIEEVDGWDGHHPLDHHCMIEYKSHSCSFKISSSHIRKSKKKWGNEL